MSQLWMERSLDALPSQETPPGYILRHFLPGDEEGLRLIYAACNLGPDTEQKVREQLLQDAFFAPERLFVVTYNGTVAATAGAWIDRRTRSAGYLHMVGTLPEHRGRGLGAVTVCAALEFNKREGFSMQRLETDDWREPALRFYINMGYYPLFTDDTHPGRWEAVARKLGRPEVLSLARRITLPNP